MKLTTYLITILAVLGPCALLQGDCNDGQAKCNDGTLVKWSCVFRFPVCRARDYDGDSEKAANTLCANHGGVNWLAANPDTRVKIYQGCFY